MTGQPDKLGALLDTLVEAAFSLGMAKNGRDDASRLGLTEAALLAVRRHVEALQAECDANEQAADALEAKVKAFSAHGETCACSFDSLDDICMHHSPEIMRLRRHVEALQTHAQTLKAEAKAEKLQARMTTQPNDQIGALLDDMTTSAYRWGFADGLNQSTAATEGDHAAALLALRRHVEALQADAARLDALEATKRLVVYGQTTADFPYRHDEARPEYTWTALLHGGTYFEGKTLRDALDALLAARPAPPTEATP